ncbi:hypothetical protein [Streptomyces sp. JWR5-1]|uniref:hypothetical protein n=1 Tax=Streptomyces sp. JWR5-1 TaxID=3122053 RepID=UPI00301A661F
MPIDRIAADQPFHPRAHKRHGRLLCASPAPPGAIHEIKAARPQGITDALAGARVDHWWPTRATGAPGTVRLPYGNRRETLPAGPAGCQPLARGDRAFAEQATATLETWLLLREPRCADDRNTDLVQAAPTLHLTCAN